MKAQDFLAQYNIAMADANAWVAGHITQPKVIYDLFKSAGMTTAMLTEIINYRYPGISESVVRQYFGQYGLDMSKLDPSGTPSGPTLNESVGAAAANELIDAVLHWQKDYQTYTDALQTALVGLTSGKTHFEYKDLLTVDINTSMINSATPGFVKMHTYHQHTWNLTRTEFVDLANSLMNSQFVDQAYRASDEGAYATISNNLIPVYDDLVARAPDYSNHWIA